MGLVNFYVSNREIYQDWKSSALLNVALLWFHMSDNCGER